MRPGGRRTSVGRRRAALVRAHSDSCLSQRSLRSMPLSSLSYKLSKMAASQPTWSRTSPPSCLSPCRLAPCVRWANVPSRSPPRALAGLIRFVSASTQEVLIGEPSDALLDVGLASLTSTPFTATVFSGSSVLTPGCATARVERVAQLLSPLAQSEVGTIRGIALNYFSHASHTGLPIPSEPMMFMKPCTSLAGPYPEPTVLPRYAKPTDGADYEGELAVVIGRRCKNVHPERALDYVLGYTAANDVSSRTLQWQQKQWCFSKGFDSSCPIGPALVAPHVLPSADPSAFHLQTELNGKRVQESGLSDMIFPVARLVSFLSQGTTLLPGTVILTGTPMGVGWTSEPKRFLSEGDEVRVRISPGVGTLVTRFVDEGEGEE